MSPLHPVLPVSPSSIPVDAGYGDRCASRQSYPEERPLFLQCKLAIGSSDDPLEGEADRTAAQVMSLGAAGKAGMRESLPRLRRATLGSAAHSVASAPPAVHRVLGSSGQPLDAETRAFMEPRFGRDFSQVRLHTDAASAESARSVGALAYTVGQHIAFGAGSYNPSSESGRNLLAHELAHTVQQSSMEAGSTESATLRRRRIPESSDADDLVRSGATDPAAHKAGLVRLIRNAWNELPPAQKLSMQTQAAITLISKVILTLESHPGFLQGSDDWNVQWVVVRLSNSGAGAAELLRAVGTPMVRLTHAAPSVALTPTTPGGPVGTFNQITFEIATGSDDLRGNSVATAKLLTSAGAELQQIKLKAQADPAWDKNSTHTVNTPLAFKMPPDDQIFAALQAGDPKQVEAFAKEIQVAVPGDKLGDPKLIDTGPRPATPDAANISTLVTGADTVFNKVASGSKNSDLKAIFGAAHVATAKARFHNAKLAMHRLHAAGKIVTDRSGYNKEVELGGLTNSEQIALAPEVIDVPSTNEHIATMVHESTHAGNAAVRDPDYPGSPTFKNMSAADKLNNAADYEVIAFRVLDSADANGFPGETFIPAGTTVGGVSAPPLTPKQTAMEEAWRTYKSAWTAGLNLHTLFVREFKNPGEWNTLDLGPEFGVAGGTHFSDSLPFWSKVENMTIHKRPGISAAAGSPSSNPVTLIDVAQSESVTRKLAAGMDATDDSTFKEADANALEASATAAQTAQIAAGPHEEAKVLVSLVRSKKVGEITGSVERDERAIARLAQADNAPSFFDDVLSPKLPSTFAD
ncbi:MAG: DUF4157 domain-containing protein [Terracidiphilus sp.]